jgi:hypothetical protein
MTTMIRGCGPAARPTGKGRGARWYCLGAVLAALLALLASCGALRPTPEAFEPQSYTPIDYQDLLQPRRANLHDGQLVRVQGYFWQPLDYDPDPVRNYLNLARHPLGWWKMRWFAVYQNEDMQGYYDLAAMDAARLELFKAKRLEPVLIYGQLASLGPGLYLHVHRLEKMSD